jgi:hypothetical protein
MHIELLTEIVLQILKAQNLGNFGKN